MGTDESAEVAEARQRYFDILEMYNRTLADAWVLRERPVWPGWAESHARMQQAVADAKARMDKAERDSVRAGTKGEDR